MTRAAAPGASEERWRETLRRLGRAAVACDLGDESVYLAEELVAQAWSLGESERLALALVVLALAAAERQGSTRLPLERARLGRRLGVLIRAAGLDLETARVARDVRKLATATSRGFVSLIGAPGEDCPLICDGESLASHRLYWAEARLAAALAPRLRAPPPGDAGALATALAQVMARPVVRGGAPVLLSDEQRAAVELAASRQLAIVSGGPGTGKTAIAAALCRVLVETGVAPQAIALCAPTGKAAKRLASSVERALVDIAEPSECDRMLAASLQEARTLHRLLGYHPGSGRFRHHARAPLAAEVVIVDEASMIDVVLMERLARALGPETRLVLFGDADQLPSVEAGAVLRDLLICGEPAGAARRLTRSYRMDAGDPAGRAVLEAALEVKAGRARSLPAEDVPLARFVDRWFRRHIAQGGRWAELARRAHAWSADGPDPATAADLAELAALLDAARVLAVTRRLPSGTGALNQLFHQRAAAELGAAAGGGRRQLAFLPGEPLILRDNDYARDLFNGDTGIALRITRAGGAGELAAVFPQGESFRAFPISALRPRLDRAYAMTVHQAQGSEYDHVALVLPSIDLPLATRELVYTALTRARKSASIAGSPARLRAALARATDRHSGLTAAL